MDPSSKPFYNIQKCKIGTELAYGFGYHGPARRALFATSIYWEFRDACFAERVTAIMQQQWLPALGIEEVATNFAAQSFIVHSRPRTK
jgi:hypothetical protein